MNFICDNCSSRKYQDIEGWGEEDGIEFADCWCEECGTLNRIYEEENI